MNTLRRVLLSIIPFLRIYCALQISTCIRYETYLASDYKMKPFDSVGDWFSRSRHYLPRKQTKIGLRSRRLYGCCDPGYQYHGYPDFACKPACESPCPKNSSCKLGQCTCDEGYQSLFGIGCIPNRRTTQENAVTTTPEPTTAQLPCNGSCGLHEKCSVTENTCVCVTGFQRSVANGCVEPKRTSSTAYILDTTRSTRSLPPACNGSCGTNEECSSDGECVCTEGYQRGNSMCEPKCEPQCHHASCVAPNTCSCWPNYDRTNDTSCRSHCSEQSCHYGNCDHDGVCVCARGFLNNGTACIWAGDAILSEPDDCDCWSRFVWQKNETEISAHQCQPLCDGDDSIEVASECINYKQCQCYEGFLVCHAQMYKCYAEEESNYTMSPTIAPLVETVAEKKGLPNHITMLLIAFLVATLVTGAILLIWQRRPNWINRLRPYNRMEPGQDQLL